MRVLVTGASGFVGRRLLPRLEAAGHQPFPTDRETDITNLDVLCEALRRTRPDAIIHLAAMSSIAESWRNPSGCYRLNFVGTRHLLQAALREAPDARVMLIGSADQYGATEPAEHAFDEMTPLRPRSPYARTKAAAEMLGTMATQRGLDVVRVRAFTHTGAGQADHFVVSSFARQAAAIRDGRQEPVMRVGNLESVRDFLHVDDVLDAYLLLLDRKAPGDIYNIASERPTSIQEVLDLLLKLAGVEPAIEIDPERWRATDWLVGDASRLRAATGWQPRVSLEAITGELYAYWREREGST